MSLLHSLLADIVDYAGLFPPAGLPMETAVNNYANYLHSEHSWMLSRFVVPAARLDEFENAAASQLPSDKDADPWRISALIPAASADDDGFYRAIERINLFNDKHADAAQGLAMIDSLEGKAIEIEHIELIAKCDELPDGECFIEIDHQEDPDRLIAAMTPHVELGLRAKIRTGGIQEKMIPVPSVVARFIERCQRHQVPFKATAGLHHPLRNQFALTYEDNAPCATMHGFLNVFLAACAAFDGAGESELCEILEQGDLGQIHVGESMIKMINRSIPINTVERVRVDFARSFGSCSFVEPVDDLCALGLLQMTMSNHS